MNRKLHLILLVVLGLVLAACGGNKEKIVPDEAPVQRAEPVINNNAWGTGLSEADLQSLGIEGNPLNYKTVYFEYNKSDIDRRSEIIIQAHAREVVGRGGTRVGLEGHADERGTRDYNLALGERRAHAVASRMAAARVGKSDIHSISYGEERPVDPAHNEAAWMKNRRVEINY